ncbi:MotA/TolQ/ExbB proton channel family protein [Acidithiobacillus ferrianus]|uniref:MotA/TolQ/ExbB proton channel family protein n=2 Tax=Acidithiobacillus ferrianus TaxID=2678518 RepID=A0A845U597_9PROT|nr:MotA/TolQ/ExbB proton channel family protein [Acidithiobacillus ferrianus]NDU42446.1 MotA/TolQ/ExbB proton channel family protein [Acidithiobacillus ferrianus]
MQTWWHLAAVSGGILYLMPLLLLVVLFVALERSWALARLLRQGATLLRDMQGAKGRDGLGERLTMALPSPQLAVLAAVLGSHDLDSGDGYAEEAMLAQATLLDRGLWMLDTAVTLAPLLGLLGTIIGMFKAFQILGDQSTAPTAITGHVAEALVATAAGLTVAIIGLIFFNALNQRVRLVLHQMEAVKVTALNRLYRQPARPHGETPVSLLARRGEI